MDPEMARQQAHEQAHANTPRPPIEAPAPHIEPPFSEADRLAVAPQAGVAGHAFRATALALCCTLVAAIMLVSLALVTGFMSPAVLLRTENLVGAGLGLLLAFAVLWPLNYRRFKRASRAFPKTDPDSGLEPKTGA
jgi:Flp pilus assembly protein TadB